MSDNRWNEIEGNEEPVPVQPNVSKLDEAVEKAKSDNASSKEWKLIEKTLNGLFIEQRRARRWGIFFKLLTFGYLIAIMVMLVTGPTIPIDESGEPHTAVIDIKGAISADDEANADSIIWSLRQAYEEDKVKAVILRINSPGGSPVQSGYIYDEIKRLRKLYPAKPLYAVITDIGASGAYYIAAAADEIYADKASLVGSIGVVAGGFGFVGLMEKVGVERRLYTAGDHKAFLDPFSPSREGETEFWQNVLDTTHKQFIEQVKLGRGDRLKEKPELFSGLVWTGEQAVELGLIDGLGSSSYVAREIVKVEKLQDYSPQEAPWKQIVDELGVSFAKAISSQMGLTQNPVLR
ncbi:MAG: signal peptide peptidase SppA [Neptuniibacter caesariensis]|uniref:Signal peptide peptidase SppA n=1 Tax=Neptuniibacter caesariensis TaxID=207954 RepID=A0A2G6JMH9_NEPCE|nr:MAG: signal peptide peptidase SppA [Neptuniibacter caesariensis]